MKKKLFLLTVSLCFCANAAFATEKGSILTMRAFNVNTAAQGSEAAAAGAPTTTEDVDEIDVIIKDATGKVCFLKRIKQFLQVLPQEMSTSCQIQPSYQLEWHSACNHWWSCALTSSNSIHFNVGEICTRAVTWNYYRSPGTEYVENESNLTCIAEN